MGQDKRDLIPRGIRGPSPLGTSTFVTLRALEPLLQYYLLLHVPLTRTILPALGLPGPYPPPPSNHLTPTPPLIPTLAHHLHLPPFSTLLLLMSILATTKQIIWLLHISNEAMPLHGALMIAAYNALVNSLNTLLFSLAAANPTYSVPWSMYIGITLFTVGIVVEPLAELQRKWFKDDPRNEGKPYAGGLFGLARSINYGAYTVWRTGFALAGGGWLWGALAAGFMAWDFSTRAVPVLEEYCEGRYGRRWEEVKRKVPYRLIPGVY